MGNRVHFTGDILTIPCVISHLSMGSMSEFPPLPLLCVENRKSIERETTATPVRTEQTQEQ